MDGLYGALRENILTLAAFSDRACGIVRNAIPEADFGSSVYRTIARACYAFYDAHGKPPKDHIADCLQSELEGSNADIFGDVLRGIDRLKDNINVEYVLSQLDLFNRMNSLRRNIHDAVDALENNDVDRAEQAIANYHAQRRMTAQEVLGIGDVARILDRAIERDVLGIGILPLTMAKIGPCRKELFLYGGPPKSGKSWFLNHVARCGVFHRWRVLIVTLEMSAEMVLLRMVQSVTSLPTKSPPKNEIELGIPYPKLMWCDGDVEFGVKPNVKPVPRPSLESPKVRAMAVDKVRKLHPLRNLRVVERPTGSLTVQGLIGLLDNLESTEGFVPDMVVLDYADLMNVKTDDYRINLGELYKRLRGLAIERNMAMVTATQLNRRALSMDRRGMASVAEDISKVFTCDAFLVYAQTELEAEMQVARLNLAAGRAGNLPRDVVISQCYDVGQFMIESGLMAKDYMADYYRELRRLRGRDDQAEAGDAEHGE